MEACNPVVVEVTRGGMVESRHRGAVAVVSRESDEPIAASGDVLSPVYPRSAVKPLQVLPLLETGAAAALSVSDEEIALACGSHAGESEHTERIAAWLTRLGLGVDDLACGIHPPFSDAAAAALVRDRRPASALHHNCSGKHAGYLATACHLREPVIGYAGPVHPVQLRVRRVISQMTGSELSETGHGIDGCGVPTYAVSLAGLARAFARLAVPDRLNRLRAEAVRRVQRAMTRHPMLIAGRDRFDTVVTAAAGGAALVKGGAEGVHVAALPALGIGIALKVDDGAKRATEAAMAALLLRYASPDPSLQPVLEGYVATPVRNSNGARVGVIRAVDGWL